MIKIGLEEWNSSKQSIREQCDHIREINDSLYLQLIDNPHSESLPQIYKDNLRLLQTLLDTEAVKNFQKIKTRLLI